ncbi:amino acid adenylation domain-containing protein [Streptomyces sp. NPDC059104]|uniref:non-ribosomal peptide synthetase n=1 Tax=Streptomyces sp. NPDC059104 TaxID=3346729 RepID=UPI0036B2DD4C
MNPSDTALSRKEQSMWLFQKFVPGRGVSNVPMAFRHPGALRWWPLQEAVTQVVARHPALRTVFPRGEDGPVRRLLDAREIVLDVEAIASTEASLEADIAAFAARPFEVDGGLLVRAAQFLLPAGGAFCFVAHHLVFDRVSGVAVAKEIAAAYDALAAGAPEPTRAAESGAVHREPAPREADLRYWREQLAGADGAAMNLLVGQEPPAEPTFAGVRTVHVLDPVTVRCLERLCRDLKVTENIVMLAAYLLLLMRHGAGPDLVVGVPVNSRRGREHARTVGYHVTTLALRVLADPAQGFAELVRSVRDAFLGGLEHASASFEDVWRNDNGTADWRTPLFRHMFNFFPSSTGTLTIDGRPLDMLDIDPHSRMDLEFVVTPHHGAKAVTAVHSSEVFGPGQVSDLLERYELLIQAAAERPDRPLAALPLLTASDAGVLASANDTARPWPAAEPSVLDRVVSAAENGADAPAFIEPDGSGRTYEQLLGHAELLRGRLAAAGVRAGDVVALAAPRGALLGAAVLAVWSLGAAYLPLDPTHPAHRLSFQLDEAAVRVVVTHGGPLPEAVMSGRTELAGNTDPDDGLPTADPSGWMRPDPDAPAYVIFTSGSTGRPKGVRLSHRNLANVVHAFGELLAVTKADRMLWLTTFAFDISALEVLLPLANGACVVTAPDEAQTRPDVLGDLLRRHGVSLVQATPTTWRLLVPRMREGLHGVRVLCGGEPLSTALARRLLDAGCRLFNVYGPTETTIWSTAAELRAETLTDPVSIGRPLANTTALVADASGFPAPFGVPGELWLAGDGVALDYLDRPELTAERFVAGPDGRRHYRTGDIARWRADGTLELLGRGDRQIKLRAHRIELGEVEAVVEEHPEVTAAAVVARGELDADGHLVAFITCDGPVDGLADRMWQYLGERLPAYSLPARISVLDRLPTTNNGKTDYRALPAGEPAGTAGAAADADSDDVTAMLTGLWREVLADPGLTARDNFFLNGGQSLLAAQLTARIEETTGSRLGLQAVFRAPTPSAMAGYLRVIEGGPR